MRSLSAAELLEVWERASDQHPIDRALTLLSACCEESWDELAALSIGRRDGLLLEIYQRLFGTALEAFAECPKCGERLEYTMSVQELASPAAAREMPLILETDEACLRLRLLNSLDVRAASRCADAAAARRMLLERCVMEASQGGSPVPLQTLQESTVDKIAGLLAAADPQAETLIGLTCCACRYSWQVVLDIESFLWVKIQVLAKRLLREVHALARAYGWREHDILALSSLRRQSYLEMAGSWPTF